MTKKKKKTTIDIVVEYLKNHRGEPPNEVAKKLGVSISTVYRAIRELRKLDTKEDVLDIFDEPKQKEKKQKQEKKNGSGDSMSGRRKKSEDLEELEEEFLDEEEEEGGEEELSLSPEAEEFVQFIDTWAPPKTIKKTHKEKLRSVLANEPDLVYDTKELFDVMTNICSIPKKTAEFLINKWADRKKKEMEESVALKQIPKPQPQIQELPYEQYPQQEVYDFGQEQTVIRTPEGETITVPKVSSSSILQRKIMEAIDNLTAVAVLRQLSDIAQGSKPKVEYDPSGRPVIRVEDRSVPTITPEHVEMIVEKKISEVEKRVSETLEKVVGNLTDKFASVIDKLNQKIDMIAKRTEEEKTNKQFELMIEMIKAMQSQMTELIKSKGTSSETTQIQMMFDKIMDMMREMQKSKDENVWKEVINQMQQIMKMRQEKQIDPFQMFQMALDLLERRLVHKEKATQFDVQLREIEAQREIEQAKLNLEKERMAMESKKDMEMAKIWMKFMDNITHELVKNVGDKLGDELGKAISMYIRTMMSRKTGTPAATAEQQLKSRLKELSDEDLVKIKQVIEEREAEAPKEVAQAMEKAKEQVVHELAERKTKQTKQTQPQVEEIKIEPATKAAKQEQPKKRRRGRPRKKKKAEEAEAV